MAGYGVQLDVEARFGADRVGQLFSSINADGSTTGVVDSAAFAAAAQDAKAEIDRVLGTVYPLPFLPDPVTGLYDATLIEVWSVITMFKGLLRRPEFWVGDKGFLETQYKVTLGILRDLQTSKSLLTTTAKPINVGAVIVTESPTDYYFIIDPDDGSGGMDGY